MDQREKEIDWILEEKYDGEKSRAFYADLERLENGEPVDYIIGYRPFLDCAIDLSYRPLIPREETEFLTNRAIQALRGKFGRGLHVLDIFAGSGCIGLAILAHLRYSQVDFSDISPDAIIQIHKNARINGLIGARAKIFESNMFAELPEKKYDCIFANPPYISEQNYASLDESVKNFEPREALLAHDEGLFFLKKFLAEAPYWLAKSGYLFVEFDTPQKDEIEHFIDESRWKYKFWHDQFDQPRWLVLEKK